MEDSKTHFAIQNYNGHDKFVIEVYTQMGHAPSKKIHLALPRGCTRNLVEDEAFWIKNSFA